MYKSGSIRAQDWRTILRLIGECRELGDERDRWRIHFLQGAARLVDAEMAFFGEMAGLLAARPSCPGYTRWGIENGFDLRAQLEVYSAIERDPSNHDVLNKFFSGLIEDDGACRSPREVVEDEAWYSSKSYRVVQHPRGVDHALWCYRSIGARRSDEFSGLMFERARGRRDFSPRHRAIVREAHSALATLIGGPLARYADLSPMDLAPRVRQVLVRLLEGEGDKEVAARLKLSPYTVKQYTKTIFRHFGVNSRTELLARWIRRGWGSGCSGLPPS